MVRLANIAFLIFNTLVFFALKYEYEINSKSELSLVRFVIFGEIFIFLTLLYYNLRKDSFGNFVWTRIFLFLFFWALATVAFGVTFVMNSSFLNIHWILITVKQFLFVFIFYSGYLLLSKTLIAIFMSATLCFFLYQIINSPTLNKYLINDNSQMPFYYLIAEFFIFTLLILFLNFKTRKV